jgi:hypothetical protein
MWLILKKYHTGKSVRALSFVLSIYRGIAKLFALSCIWILVGGGFRVATFRDFEWSHAVHRQQTEGLAVKYFIAAGMLTFGVLFWLKIVRKMRSLQNPFPDDSR